MQQTPNQPAGPGPTPERIMQLAWGYAPPLIIEAGIRHRIFDLLDAKPSTAEEVARKTEASPRGVRMILNALVALQFARREGETYALTPESSTFLVSTKPSFIGGIYKHISKHLIPRWMELSEIVRTGRGARAVNQQDTGANFFAEFVEDIFPMSYGAAQALGKSLNIGDKPIKVLDIAAGSGVWGIALAQAGPKVQVTAVDWEGVLPVTRRITQKFKVGDRFKFVAGDINTIDLGQGYNVATLGHILHSEGPGRCKTLLKRIFDALAPGGTIAIAEFLANDDRTGPVNAMIFAINMLVNTEEGDTFTVPEISRWLRDAGFENPRTMDVPGPSPLILANKPG